MSSKKKALPRAATGPVGPNPGGVPNPPPVTPGPGVERGFTGANWHGYNRGAFGAHGERLVSQAERFIASPDGTPVPRVFQPIVTYGADYCVARFSDAFQALDDAGVWIPLLDRLGVAHPAGT